MEGLDVFLSHSAIVADLVHKAGHKLNHIGAHVTDLHFIVATLGINTLTVCQTVKYHQHSKCCLFTLTANCSIPRSDAAIAPI